MLESSRAKKRRLESTFLNIGAERWGHYATNQSENDDAAENTSSGSILYDKCNEEADHDADCDDTDYEEISFDHEQQFGDFQIRQPDDTSVTKTTNTDDKKKKLWPSDEAGGAAGSSCESSPVPAEVSPRRTVPSSSRTKRSLGTRIPNRRRNVRSSRSSRAAIGREGDASSTKYTGDRRKDRLEASSRVVYVKGQPRGSEKLSAMGVGAIAVNTVQSDAKVGRKAIFSLEETSKCKRSCKSLLKEQVLLSSESRQTLELPPRMDSDGLLPSSDIHHVDSSSLLIRPDSMVQSLSASSERGVSRTRSLVVSPPIVMMMDDQGHAMSADEVKALWSAKGMCETCGQVRTHDRVRVGPFGLCRRMEPRTEQGCSYKGYCLRCNDIEALREVFSNHDLPVDWLRHVQPESMNADGAQGMMTDSSFINKKNQTPMQVICSSWKFQLCLGVLAMALVAGGVAAAVVLSGGGEPFVSLPPTASPTATPSTPLPSSAPTSLRWFPSSQIVIPTNDSVAGFASRMVFNSLGTRIAVASPHDGQDRGRVDVYQSNLNQHNSIEQWTPVANSVVGDQMGDLAGHGMSFSADGTTLAVGSPGGEGLVRIFRVVGSSWAQIGQTLTGPSNVSFGHSVALNENGTVVVVGAPLYSLRVDSREGMVRVYKLGVNMMWRQDGEIVGSNPGNQMGFDVGIDGQGSLITAGSPGDHTRWPNGGKINWLHNDGTDWIDLLIDDTLGDDANHRLGERIEMSRQGTAVVAGIPNARLNTMEAAGLVDVRTFTIGFEAEQAGFPVAGTYPHNGFGTDISVSATGELFAATGANRNGVTGSARAYEFTNQAQWEMLGHEIPGVEIGDEEWIGNGPSIAFQSNRLRLAVGYESVKVADGQSRPLIQIWDYTGVSIELVQN